MQKIEIQAMASRHRKNPHFPLSDSLSTVCVSADGSWGKGWGEIVTVYVQFLRVNNRLIVSLHKNSQNDAYKHDLSFTPLLFSLEIMNCKNLKYFSSSVWLLTRNNVQSQVEVKMFSFCFMLLFLGIYEFCTMYNVHRGCCYITVDPETPAP